MGDKPIESKPGSTLPSSVTMSEIQWDRLAKIAIENWSKSGDSTEPKKQFDPELVKEIYQTELLLKERQRKTVPLHRVMILEVSQYLESYLWPNFDPEFEHVMWMMLMINEKVCFTNSDGAENWDPRSPFRIRLPKMLENNTNSTPGKMKSTDSVNDAAMSDADDEKEKLIVEPYMPPDPGPYPQDQARQNSVRFTPKQIEVITSGTARTYNGCGSTCYGKDIQLCRS